MKNLEIKPFLDNASKIFSVKELNLFEQKRAQKNLLRAIIHCGDCIITSMSPSCMLDCLRLQQSTEARKSFYATKNFLSISATKPFAVSVVS